MYKSNWISEYSCKSTAIRTQWKLGQQTSTDSRWTLLTLHSDSSRSIQPSERCKTTIVRTI